MKYYLACIRLKLNCAMIYHSFVDCDKHEVFGETSRRNSEFMYIRRRRRETARKYKLEYECRCVMLQMIC